MSSSTPSNDEAGSASVPVVDDRPPRRRGWSVLGALLVVGFIVSVASSTRQAAVPVGVSGGMSDMSMSTSARGALRLTMRDVDDRVVRIPGGRPGVAVFVEARNCSGCVRAVRSAAGAVRRSGGRVALTVVCTDSGTSRAEVRAFARSAGRPAARYVVDDRNGSLAAMFGASGLGEAVVYDGRGMVAARPSLTPGALALALRRARG